MQRSCAALTRVFPLGQGCAARRICCLWFGANPKGQEQTMARDEIKPPYLVFLGDAADALAAKTSIGVVQWRPKACIGQLRLAGCKADAGLPDMSPREAAKAGARTMIVGAVNRGGTISKLWTRTLVAALAAGIDLASGLHERLADV